MPNNTAWSNAPLRRVIAATCFALLLVVGACSPGGATPDADLEALEARVVALEAAAAAQPVYPPNEVMIQLDGDVRSGLVATNRLPIIAVFEDTSVQGDSQSVTVRFLNPYDVTISGISFVAGWRNRANEAATNVDGQKEIEYSGEIPPGGTRTVRFSIGPLAAEDFATLTISNVRIESMRFRTQD